MTPKAKTFIRALAEFLAANAAAKSIAAEMESLRPVTDKRPRVAIEWAKLHAASPIMGYATVDEAEVLLKGFFR